MSLFRYARDYDGDATAQQLLADAGWLFVALVGIFIGSIASARRRLARM
jgi:hypothetical protein